MFDSVLYDGSELDDHTDAFGVTWCVTEIDGWWDTPPLEQELVHPSGQDREVVAASNLRGRAMVLRGTAQRAPDAAPAALLLAMDRLAFRSWPLLTAKDLTVVEAGVSRSATVLTAGSLRRRQLGKKQFAYELPLLAEDPRKYSTAVQTLVLPGTAANGGSFQTDPVVTLVDGGNYVLTNTTQGAGATVAVTGAPAGAVLDMRARTLTAGGSDLYGAVSAASVWWTLLPGANVIVKTGGAAEVAWRDAWL